MPHRTPQGSEVTRRAVVAGTGVLAVSATLAACSVYGKSDQPAAPADQPGSPADQPTPGGQALGSTGDIPVGGGKVFADQEIVVTQPSSGTFKAFSATCTHTGCTLNKVVSGTINCPCHGSKFDINDGSVVNGPASRPLAQRQVTVSGDTIQLA